MFSYQPQQQRRHAEPAAGFGTPNAQRTAPSVVNTHGNERLVPSSCGSPRLVAGWASYSPTQTSHTDRLHRHVAPARHDAVTQRTNAHDQTGIIMHGTGTNRPLTRPVSCVASCATPACTAGSSWEPPLLVETPDVQHHPGSYRWRC